MQNELKHLNENILPEAFDLLEDGKTINEVRIEFSHRVEPRWQKHFVNSLNFYVKNVFRQRYRLLKNILVGLFALELVLLTYETVTEALNGTRTLSTIAIILNTFLFALFINAIYKIAVWEGRYIRSVLIFMSIFTVGDLFIFSAKLGDSFFVFKFILQIVIGILGLFLYKKIFPSHGISGAPKEVIKEKDILDDFR